ncbi:extracellular solute-binding protein [Nonomuraea sp. NPDC055795]
MSHTLKRHAAALGVLALLLAGCSSGSKPSSDFREENGRAAAKRWVDTEFTPSTLAKDQQLAEMEWFLKAAAPYRGMEINVVSETITTHEYESRQLAKAFTEITGIRIKHDLIQEGDVVEKLQTQIQGNQNIYDAYVNDSDLIGTHARGDYVVPLSDYMAGEGKNVTSPTLDLKDFIGISFTTGPDKKVYQLPDQQFANLYWFRYDWFTDPEIKKQFKAAYGYDLGVAELGALGEPADLSGVDPVVDLLDRLGTGPFDTGLHETCFASQGVFVVPDRPGSDELPAVRVPRNVLARDMGRADLTEVRRVPVVQVVGR